MKIYKVIGLMSGTSLDGLDLAYCHISEKNGKWQYEIKNTKSISYNTEMVLLLKNSIQLPAHKLLKLHNDYGSWLGKKTKEFIDEYQLKVDFIASHGHTTHHRPELGFTFQIGSGQHLANVSGHKIICDFRTNDLALGGQGAPLVPIGDRLFFDNYDFCLNLGGISNISFDVKGERVAYDIGLANMVLNYITRRIDIDYDEDGNLARSGQLNQTMLNRLNNLEYYSLPYPKSIGYEWFLDKVVPIVESTSDVIENLLHTSIHHISEKIAEQVALHSTDKKQEILVTGGGAFNSFLIEILQQKLGKSTIAIVPDRTLIEFKEALIFALMGVLRLEEKINTLSSVTGSERDSSSGVIYIPN